jgi:hypothetical protein
VSHFLNHLSFGNIQGNNPGYHEIQRDSQAGCGACGQNLVENEFIHYAQLPFWLFRSRFCYAVLFTNTQPVLRYQSYLSFNPPSGNTFNPIPRSILLSTVPAVIRRFFIDTSVHISILFPVSNTDYQYISNNELFGGETPKNNC